MFHFNDTFMLRAAIKSITLSVIILNVVAPFNLVSICGIKKIKKTEFKKTD
jgi:hypothetical protein